MFVMFQNRNVKRCFTFYNLWLFLCLSCLCLCLPGRRLDNSVCMFVLFVFMFTLQEAWQRSHSSIRSPSLQSRPGSLWSCTWANNCSVCQERKIIFLNRTMILKMPRVQGGLLRDEEGWNEGNIFRQRCFSIHKELGIFLESRHQAIFSSYSNLELLTLLKRGSCVKNISFQLCQPNSSSPLSL